MIVVERDAGVLEERAQCRARQVRHMLFPDEAVVARADELRRIGYFENHVSAGLGERLERLHEGLRAVRVLEDMARQHNVGTTVARREALRAAGVEGSLQRLKSGAAVAHVE